MPTVSLPGAMSRGSDLSGVFVPPRLLVGEPLPIVPLLPLAPDFIPELIARPDQVTLPPSLPGVLLLTAALAEQASAAEWVARFTDHPRLAPIAVGDSPMFDAPELSPLLAGAIPWPASDSVVRRAIRAALVFSEERGRYARSEEALARSSWERAELNAIGIALSTERDPEGLLRLVLTKARKLVGADAGSLYLVEPGMEVNADGTGSGRMRFVLAQNESISVPFTATTIPLSPRTIAGYVALKGEPLVLDDAYLIPRDSPYSFNPDFDRKIGYRTKSMLVVPLKDHRDRVLGVLQLINRKKRPDTKLTLETAERRVIPFDERDIDLSRSLASQAAVAIENTQLIESIQRLFEGFVTASVTAIEQRDPTTSGHSSRVAVLTCGLAEMVDRSADPRFRDILFSPEQIRELRYASLLHDFGKVGVREAVLIKAKKLYPHELEVVRDRFEYLRRSTEVEVLRSKLSVLQGNAVDGKLDEALAMLDQSLEAQWAELDRLFQIVLASNEPTILPDGNFETLQELARWKYRLAAGDERALLTPDEVRVLSIRKGSLDERERLEIESHVTQTFAFLSKIPWTPELGRVPEIAYAHHEKLNGRGYPRRLSAEEIPIASRIMTVADIYDALTASDRPYKKAIPADRAFDILGAEVREGLLDGDLVRIFIEGRVWERTAGRIA